MKKPFFTSLCILFVSWFSVSWLSPERNNAKILSDLPVKNSNTSVENFRGEKEVIQLYNQLGLEEKGLSKKAFEYAYKGYNKLLKTHLIKRAGYLTICDFSQSSNNKRLYIIDLDNNEILANTYVAHGKNSGGEFARRFSNKPSSQQSSLGFYVTKNTYYGENGLSLKVAGLEPGFNDKAYRRAIVVHGADYIEESWLTHSKYMGRSFGCPAVPKEESAFIINTIKNGTCLFIYHPSTNYLKGSKLLNG